MKLSKGNKQSIEEAAEGGLLFTFIIYAHSLIKSAQSFIKSTSNVLITTSGKDGQKKRENSYVTIVLQWHSQVAPWKKLCYIPITNEKNNYYKRIALKCQHQFLLQSNEDYYNGVCMAAL